MDGVGVAAATVVVNNALAVLKSEASRKVRAFVRPVKRLAVERENALACDPVLASVFRFTGERPAVSELLLKELAQMKSPGATLVTLFSAARRDAWRRTKLTPDVSGFQTP